MRKKAIHAGILASVFVVAMILFGYAVNRNHIDLTADIGNASLPRVSFVYNSYKINTLVGYTSELEMATLRDQITPVIDGKVQMQIQENDKEVRSVAYEVYSIDGKKKMYSQDLELSEDKAQIEIPQKLLEEGERFLKVTLRFADGRASYYTRIADASKWNLDRCMAYVKNFFDKERNKEAAAELQPALEPNSQSDNQTYQTVTIHSDFEHVTWGSLQPEVIGDVQWQIKEANSMYMSVMLTYQVDCVGEEKDTKDRYNVNEFFRVRYSENKQMYLLDYNRTMNQLFDGGAGDVDENGVLLGVTDWNDIYNLCERDHIAASRKDAVRIAVNAGIDMAMVPSSWDFCIYLRELVEEGQVSMERIDDAVSRVLRLKFRLGLFEKPFWNTGDFPEFASDEYAAVALQAAVESEVLLKNEGGLLPLERSARILLAGPNANSMRCLNGGWSYSWQGDRCDEFAGDYNTIYEALRNKFDHVDYVPGVEYAPPRYDNWQEECVTGIDKAVSAAAGADVIIACIGENSYCETPGNMDDLNLSQNQKELVRALAATGKPLVLILNEGRPRVIGDIEPLAQAVVDILLPGNYGGDALADLLAGDANFSARLPFTYPRMVGALATYDYKPCENMAAMTGEYNYDAVMDVQWPFGHGLSYTEFAYSNFGVDRRMFGADDVLTFTVDVTNVGKVAGKEAVMLYSSDLVASLTPDVIRLRDFEKVALEPGESRTVTFAVPASDLAFVGHDGCWRLEEGEFRMRCGSETLRISCTQTKVWDTPNIP